ncbi:MAG TPA: bidirectional hydrogenase complex protein HoxU [Candidatus Bipolaricaulis sp.]|nr:bidirectional hydrogenase complex protein HoxU [Candidatus Bipolaricaulis sp.]HPD06777.1 bidirectional hydrogenase complex protein HoxU [Candidatus Bipolaricaulis sp.]HRS13432.1 bidirectional hydrogenase complex protein HoxU [Candidatus Bipolaricaulis sp.]HRU22138.1 bidirectional hydrogenase complex protein HoxU [Candidatus Bipolaricaulis sp.]
MINLRIDDVPAQAEPGQTILDAARAAGVRIPTLCHLEALCPVGACRLCLVEIRNWNGKLVPACATPAQEGLDVVANSDRLTSLRRTILELLFAERNHICAFCVSNGHCELQDLATELGMDHVTFPYRFPALALDASHAKFGIDHNRCVLCGRCVRACAEVEGAFTWGFAGRGVHTLVEADLGDRWGRSVTCTGCGKCVQACPTGALFEKGKITAEQEKRPALLAEITERRPRA